MTKICLKTFVLVSALFLSLQQSNALAACVCKCSNGVNVQNCSSPLDPPKQCAESACHAGPPFGYKDQAANQSSTQAPAQSAVAVPPSPPIKPDPVAPPQQRYEIQRVPAPSMSPQPPPTMQHY